MVMADTNRMDETLEALFVAARRDVPDLPPGLLARVLADADAELAARSAPRALDVPAPRGSVLAALLGELVLAIGGWRAISGLATATVAGVWIGFAGVGSLSLTAADLLGGGTETYASVNLLPGDDVFALASGTEDAQ